ncbi:hypothetical protein ACLKA7_008040 [Drosophila subpalustris]
MAEQRPMSTISQYKDNRRHIPKRTQPPESAVLPRTWPIVIALMLLSQQHWESGLYVDSSLLLHSAADNAVAHGSAYWPSTACGNAWLKLMRYLPKQHSQQQQQQRKQQQQMGQSCFAAAWQRQLTHQSHQNLAK